MAEEIEVRPYYASVLRRAVREARQRVGTHAVFALAVTVVTYAVAAVGFGAGSAGLTQYVLIPVVTIVGVVVLYLGAEVVRAPLLLARDARDDERAAVEEAVRAERGRPEQGKDPVSAEHRDALQKVARTLHQGIAIEQHAYYGGARDAAIVGGFIEHFPEVETVVQHWNGAVAERSEAQDKLRGWVTSRLHALGYDRPPFGGGLDTPIAQAALREPPQLPWSEVHGCLQLDGAVVLVLDASSGAQPPEGIDRGKVETDLNNLCAEAAAREEHQAVQQAAGVVTTLRKPLEEALQVIAAKDVIRGSGDCKLC